MANKDLPNGFRAVMTTGGHSPPIFTAYTTSNLTVAPGDALTMLSTGVLDIATATSAAIFGVCQSKITGETGVRKKCLYVPAADDIIFEGQCSGTFTPSNVGESVDIEGTTGIMEINENAQSVGVARLIGLSGEVDNAAGANARVFFTWTKTQWNGQSS
jgi:hypothetical protein